MSKIKTALILIALILTVTLVAGLLTYVAFIGNIGTVKTFGVECDTALIDWGMIGVGETVYRTVNFRSNGTVPIGNMNYTTENWNPNAVSEYILVGWNYTGEQINTDWVPVQFSLTVFSNVTGVDNFSFDLIVTAVE